MTIKVWLTEEEENMILDPETAASCDIERNKIYMNRAISQMIAESDLDFDTYKRLNIMYHLEDKHNRKEHVYRCTMPVADMIYRMRREFRCSEESIYLAILYRHREKMMR